MIITAISESNALSQGCDSASFNFICPGTPPPPVTLEEYRFIRGCLSCSCPGNFAFDQTAFYTFHTNVEASSGQVKVDVSILDCDFNTAGDNDSVKVMIIPLLPNDNPCNPISIEQMECAIGDTSEFQLVLNGLLSDHDYLLALGSNHDTINGPCQVAVEISGTGVEINASVDPLSVSLGETAVLLVEGADSTSSINWSPPEFVDDPALPDPVAIPEVTTVFQVNAKVGECNLTDFVSLRVGPPIEPFTAFSPNSDGVNEFWKIRKIEVFPNCQVEVFDRWGQNVFKSIGYEQPWDGTNNGKPLPTGPYYFIIELNSILVTIPPVTGVVSLFH